MKLLNFNCHLKLLPISGTPSSPDKLHPTFYPIYSPQSFNVGGFVLRSLALEGHRQIELWHSHYRYLHFKFIKR